MSAADTAIGSYLEATLEIPADTDAATYSALTGWVESENETNLGDLGLTNGLTTHNLVKSGTIVKRATYADAGQTSLSFLFDAADPLQQLLNAANGTRVVVTFVENLKVGAFTQRTYFQAVVTSAVRVPSDGTSAVMQNYTLDISGLFTPEA